MRHPSRIIAVLLVLLVVAACSSSDDTAADTTTPTTSAAATTMSPEAAIATVEALVDARNAYKADAVAAYFAEGARIGPLVVGSSEWEEAVAESEAVEVRETVSDCEVDDATVRCLVTYEESLLGGKAGLVMNYEETYAFDDQGQIAGIAFAFRSSEAAAVESFEKALGLWMANAHPEAMETFYFADYYGPDLHVQRYENWYTPDGAAQLSALIDEFVAQSDEYPLPR